ncbi:MAG TPA: ribosome assembly cofactor RimP [Bacteroidales bacterium]|nr:ribosome assembly cofactor RimP [Bacteroidales bacterium]
MIESIKILEIIDSYLEGSDKFLVDLKVKPGNKILVFIDGDHGIDIEDCVELSRFIESKLKSEEEDYSLEVSSAGAEAPIRLKRQYHRHIGRMFRIILTDKIQLRGQLLRVEPEGIVLNVQQTTTTDKGKKKIQWVEKYCPFEKIDEARIELSFK